ncbi:limbic system-associated membrane protein-like [Lytechinus pictus]|uniref:limbic system-associated membrane protein-like n=1 Tax=Lytechinus pictus TaxID=7653 RepID=UPI0030B9B2FC
MMKWLSIVTVLIVLASKILHMEAGKGLLNELIAIPTCNTIILGSTVFPCANHYQRNCPQLPQNEPNPGAWMRRNCLDPTRPTVVTPYFNRSDTVFNHTRTQGEGVVLKCRINRFNNNFILKWTKRDTGSTLSEPIFNSNMETQINSHRSFSMVRSSDNQSVTAELRISRLGPNDAGVYRCVFQQISGFESGSDLSGEQLYRIDVRYPARVRSIGPRIAPFWSSDQPDKFYFNETANITLTCIADGYPRPAVTWRLHGYPSLSERMNSFTDVDGSLYIPKITRNYSGIYLCSARNSLNRRKSTRRVELIVQYPPQSEQSYEVHKRSAGRYLLLQGSFTGLPSPTYHWLKNGKLLSARNNSSEAVSGRKLVIVGIEPGSHYANYTCVATNILGSASVKFEVNGSPYPPVILNKQALSTRRRSFNLSWSPGLNLQNDIPVTSYRLLYRRLEIKSEGNEMQVIYYPNDAPNSINLPGNVLKYYLTELKENSTYETEVCPINDFGKGDCANYTFYTPNENRIISQTTLEQTENSAEISPETKSLPSTGRASCSTSPSIGCMSILVMLALFCTLDRPTDLLPNDKT